MLLLVASAVNSEGPAAIRLRIAQGMRVIETAGPDGKKVFDVQVISAG